MTIIIKVDTDILPNNGIDTGLSLEDWNNLDNNDKDKYLIVTIEDSIYVWLEDSETGEIV